MWNVTKPDSRPAEHLINHTYKWPLFTKVFPKLHPPQLSPLLKMLSVFVWMLGGVWVCFSLLPCVLTWMCHSANWQNDKSSGLNSHTETGRLLEKGPHPKTAGPMAEDQKSPLKHLLFTLAIFTGKGRNREGARKRRYTRDDHNLAYSLNAALYRKTIRLFLNVPQIFTNWILNGEVLIGICNRAPFLSVLFHCANLLNVLCFIKLMWCPKHTQFECFKRKMPWVDEGSESVIHQWWFPNPLSARVLWV